MKGNQKRKREWAKSKGKIYNKNNNGTNGNGDRFKRKKRGNDDGGNTDGGGDGYHTRSAVTLTNASFEAYYKELEIVPEGEWEEFMEALRRPLPATFRINGAGRYAKQMREFIKENFIKKRSRGYKQLRKR